MQAPPPSASSSLQRIGLQRAEVERVAAIGGFASNVAQQLICRE